jgi:uncharacterized protein
MVITREILEIVRDQYQLDPEGHHGFAHWARVRANGLKLAETERADVAVVESFALFHDCRRWDDGSDLEHGKRAAEYVGALRGEITWLNNKQFELLETACRGHTTEISHSDITIQVCWDADRLDLGRIGVKVDTRFLSTASAKRAETLAWADERAVGWYAPPVLGGEWAVLYERS